MADGGLTLDIKLVGDLIQVGRLNGITPRLWTHNFEVLDLMVGGMLSNANISRQALCCNPKTSSVKAVKVVIKKLESLICSETHNSNPFFKGFGRFAIITRARVLLPIPYMMIWIWALHAHFDELAQYAYLLVIRPENNSFDYVEVPKLWDPGGDRGFFIFFVIITYLCLSLSSATVLGRSFQSYLTEWVHRHLDVRSVNAGHVGFNSNLDGVVVDSLYYHHYSHRC